MIGAPPVKMLSELLAGIVDFPASAADCRVTGLAFDSRCVRQGDLFIATRGLRHHGLEFLPTVRQAGAAAVVWEPPFPVGFDAAGLPSVAVEGLRDKVGLIASRFYGEPSRRLRVVGITGTDGKTSCAHFIAEALSDPETPCGLLGTLGYGVYGRVEPASHTTPDALSLQRLLAELCKQGVRAAAMEVSSHALAQGRVAGTEFAVAVLTNLTRDHLDYHGDLEAYAAAKRWLFLGCQPQCAVLNVDDAFGRELALALDGRTQVVAYGLGARSSGGAFVWGEDVELLAPVGLRLRVVSSWGEGVLQAANLLGRFNAYNLLAALAALLALGMSLAETLERVSRVSPVPGRMQRFGGGVRPLAVVDYAHTPHALEQVLLALREHVEGRLWCVFGCGGDRDPGKRPHMGAVAERSADRVIVTDDNPRTEDPRKIVNDILAGMAHPERARVVHARGEAIMQILGEASAGDIVLIAGKGHEDYQLLGAEKIPFSDSAVVQQWLGAAA